MSQVPLPLLRFCAEEVDRQGDQPVAVYWMVQAWLEAQRIYQEYAFSEPAQDPRFRLTPGLVEHLGKLVQPEMNPKGFRTKNVWVGNRMGTLPMAIRLEMDALFTPDRLLQMDAATLYKAFEDIHPFADGNGRTGKIIFNWRRGSLDDPALPPNFWGGSNS